MITKVSVIIRNRKVYHANIGKIFLKCGAKNYVSAASLRKLYGFERREKSYE